MTRTEAIDASSSAERPLAGLRVIELGDFVTAAYCTRTLALLGAEVWKLEPLGGDSSRRYGPFKDDEADPEGSALYLYLNVEKRGITLDLDTPGGADVFKALVRTADVVVENVGQRRLHELGIGFDDLRLANPDILVVALSPFGLTGPRSTDAATHLSIFHGGGEGITLPGGTGWRLFPDREPIQSAPLSAHYDAGSLAAVAVCTSVLARVLRSSDGSDDPAAELIDISEQEVQHGLNRAEMQRFPQRGFVETRATRDMAVGDIFQTRDGFVALEPLEWPMWKGLCDAMGRPELATDERFKDQVSLYANGHEANTYMADWAIRIDKDEAYHTAQEHGCAAAPVRSPRDLYDSEQLRVRGFFSEVEDLGLDVPHAPYRMFESHPCESVEQRRLRRPPRLGEHNAEVYGEVLGWTADDVAERRREGLI